MTSFLLKILFTVSTESFFSLFLAIRKHLQISVLQNFLVVFNEENIIKLLHFSQKKKYVSLKILQTHKIFNKTRHTIS